MQYLYHGVQRRLCTDRILGLRLFAQIRREFHQPLFAAYLDIKATFNSLDTEVMRFLLRGIGVPGKCIKIIRYLNTGTTVPAFCRSYYMAANRCPHQLPGFAVCVVHRKGLAFFIQISDISDVFFRKLTRSEVKLTGEPLVEMILFE